MLLFCCLRRRAKGKRGSAASEAAAPPCAMDQQDIRVRVEDATRDLAIFNPPKDTELDDGEAPAARRELRPGDIVLFFEQPYTWGELSALTWGIVIKIETTLDDDGNVHDASVKLNTDRGFSYTENKSMVYRRGDHGKLVDASGGNWVDLSCVKLVDGALKPGTYTTDVDTGSRIMRRREAELNKKLSAEGFINSADEGISFGIKESTLKQDVVLEAVMAAVVARHIARAKAGRPTDTGNDDELDSDLEMQVLSEAETLFNSRLDHLGFLWSLNPTDDNLGRLMLAAPGKKINVFWNHADKKGVIVGGGYESGTIVSYLPYIGAHAFNVKYEDEKLYETILEQERWILGDIDHMSATDRQLAAYDPSESSGDSEDPVTFHQLAKAANEAKAKLDDTSRVDGVGPGTSSAGDKGGKSTSSTGKKAKSNKNPSREQPARKSKTASSTAKSNKNPSREQSARESKTGKKTAKTPSAGNKGGKSTAPDASNKSGKSTSGTDGAGRAQARVAESIAKSQKEARRRRVNA